MFPKEFGPYLVALIVVALLARRVMKAQKARPVRMWRLWTLPAILLLATGSTLAKEPAPSLLVAIAFVLAAAGGGALGWYRVHTLEFTVDPETRAISSKATPFGAILLVGLLLFRYALKYLLNAEGVSGTALVPWTDGATIFTACMLIAQSAHTWGRARKLLPPKQPAPMSGTTE